MSLSMYQASIPALVQMLNNLSAILDKTEAHAQDRTRRHDTGVALRSDRRTP